MRSTESRSGSVLAGPLLAGALLAPLAALGLATLLALPALSSRFDDLRALVASALSPSGWVALPLLGGGLGVLVSRIRATSGTPRWRATALGIALCLTGGAFLVRAPAWPPPGAGAPRGARAKAQVIRRATFRSPSAIEGILPYARDPDPVVREQAVLAFGVNMVVAGIEGATPEHPSRFEALPLRDSLRASLVAALADSAEGVRAEAARALWKSPRSFGTQPMAAETLAAVLDRALRPDAVERLAWLALDAAAGSPQPRLKAAALRFAAATPDSDLARAARIAARP